MSRLEGFLESRALFGLQSAALCFTLLTCLGKSLAYEEFHAIEFVTVSIAMLWAKGIQPYQNIFAVMGPVGFYGPLCYLGPAALGRILGTAHSPHFFLLTFRMLIFTYLLGTLFLIYRLIRRIGGSRNLALVVCALLIAGDWCTLSARPDWQSLFYVALSLSLLSSKDEPNVRSVALTGVFLAVAFLIYQKHLSLLAAALINFAARKQIRMAGVLAGTFLATVALCLGPLGLITRGLLFVHCFFWIRVTASLPNSGEHLVFQEAGLPLYGLAAMAGYSTVWLARHARTGFERLLKIYTPVACVSTLVSLHTVGTTTNHFLEPVLALSLTLALFITASLRQGAAESPFRRSIGLLFFFLALLYPLKNVSDSARYWRAEILGIRGKYDWTVGHEKELERLREGSLLSDDPAVSFRTDHPEGSFEGSYFTRILMPKGFFDTASTVEKIRRQTYSWIVLDPKGSVYDLFKNEIHQTYRFIEYIGPRGLWIPLRKSPLR